MSDFLEMKRQFIIQCSDWDNWNFDTRVRAFEKLWPIIKVNMYHYYDRAVLEIDWKKEKEDFSGLPFSYYLKVFDLAQKYFNNKAFL